MNTEDKFYFGKSGQPERFAIGNKHTMATLNEFEKLLKPHWDVLFHGETRLSGTHDPRNPDNEYRYQAKRAIADFVNACVAGPKFAKQIIDDIRVRVNQYIDHGRDKSVPQYRAAVQIAKALDAIRGPLKSGFSRPGQPERFADGTESFLTIKGVRYRIVGTRKDARGNMVYDLHGTSKTAHPVPFTLVKFLDDGRWVLWGAHGGEVARGKIEASRPGSPDKFDASSLDRGDFAEASQSPMLGKLLAAKVMPEGGWRAVQVGSDTLVISFEDADLASDFGRRVATKGYNATSPVQAIGRYWNVEVKNG